MRYEITVEYCSGTNVNANFNLLNATKKQDFKITTSHTLTLLKQHVSKNSFIFLFNIIIYLKL